MKATSLPIVSETGIYSGHQLNCLTSLQPKDRIMQRFRIGIATTLMLLAVASQATAKDIVETAVSAGNFKTLVAAVKAAGLVDTLQGKGPFTVFAPSDDAFAKLPSETIATLLKPENKEQLTAILTYHVVAGKVLAKDAYGVDSAGTVNGQRISIRRNSGRLVINESLVTATDIECDNGVIHVIDTVLLPEAKSIPEVAAANGQFGTLLAAVTEAELAETLGSKGPFTVFAPTDAAFEKLPKGTVANLLKKENRDQLVKILTYHVVSGRVFSNDAIAAESATTLQGQSVKVGVNASGIAINEARVVAADIQASNGVIHVIDSVLLPPSLSASESRDLLERAVAKGSRAFNNGDFRTCCSVYESACQSIVDCGTELPEGVNTALAAALRRASKVKHEGERAWVLRHGIDLAYYALH